MRVCLCVKEAGPGCFGRTVRDVSQAVAPVLEGRYGVVRHTE
jgi:hypothetical protein